jgi:hypothetical protein
MENEKQNNQNPELFSFHALSVFLFLHDNHKTLTHLLSNLCWLLLHTEKAKNASFPAFQGPQPTTLHTHKKITTHSKPGRP